LAACVYIRHVHSIISHFFMYKMTYYYQLAFYGIFHVENCTPISVIM